MAFCDLGDGIFLMRGSSKNLVFTIYPGIRISFLFISRKTLVYILHALSNYCFIKEYTNFSLSNVLCIIIK